MNTIPKACQQILVVHGGTTFDTNDDYISYLKNKEIDLEWLKPRVYWSSTITKELGNKHQVLVPKMPDSTNARYQEWKIWFERIISLLENNLILIGHSLGGIFLAKYLSENTIKKTVKATILIAAPFDDTISKESLADFKLPNSLEKFSSQGGKIYLFHSKDDPYISLEQLEKYEKALPKARSIIFTDKQHFNQEDFPELANLIRKI